MSEKSAAKGTVLSLPKGGGAIKGIGETFQANLFSGTANHSVPIAISPGRNGFGPKLSLEYSSGNGNSIFGLGWQITLPRITRKTEKGLPRYDSDDVFVMSGAEDLVRRMRKVVDPDSGQETWAPKDPVTHGDFVVFDYRPRTEGLFARIERWVHGATGETHWRCITKDNVTSLFGTSAASRLADPANDQRVYEWLLDETFDAFGNHSICEYAADDPALYTSNDPAVHLPEIFEQRRLATQRYIRRICYGNLPEPLLDAQQRPITYPDGAPVGCLRDGRRYAFEVVFDYGDWDIPTVLPHPAPPPVDRPELFGADAAQSTTGRAAPLRADRFSHFRAGFDIRTLRRCRRVLMFHHFAELSGPTLVRSTDITYSADADTQASLLSSVTVTGYDKNSADGGYRSAGLPPVSFSYSQFRPHEQRYQPLKAVGGEMPPLALNDPNMELVDLFGDGLPDILHTGPNGFRYWRNLGNGLLDRPRTLAQMPAGISLDQPGVGFGDMSGNGIADLLVNAGPLPGFFETTTDGAWKRFTPYESFPGFAPQNSNVRMVDLTGDGRADALLTEDRQFLWFECLGEKGFARPQSIARVHDLNQFPDVFFDDQAGRVRLADMSGDGLNDIVLVHNGRIDYWPNLGYGRFGKRVTMANAPRLDFDFDPKRLFLADLNGTGCADLVYVDNQRVCFWFNQNGNSWSERQVIRGTPRATDASAVEFADVFGSGTATLLWSRDFTGSSEGNYKALDFCGGVKPYVLVGMNNNMGSTTRVSYAPSTRYFLEDQANRRHWITSLPFPVQVVDKVEVIDHISQTKRVTTYKYHHGHYDGREREFCGFGRVDQFDTESFEDFSQPGLHGVGISFSAASAYHAPPVETRTWFDTGVYFDTRGIRLLDYRDLTERFRQEYYQQDNQAAPLGEHDVAIGDAAAEAYRALRGAQLRTEVYAHDGGARALHPYQVDERRYRVALLQPKLNNQHAVYFSHTLESLTYHYERNPSDPRIGHDLTLEVDAFGAPLKTLSIGYGRRQPDPDLPTQADRDRQTRALITYTENSYTNAIDDPETIPDSYHAPLPSETRSYELTGFAPLASGAQRFSYVEWVENDFARITGAQSIGYEQQASPAIPQKRLIEHVRTYYRRDNLTGLLPLGALESLALPGEGHRLAFTAGLIERVYGNRVNNAMLDQCGYVLGEDQQTRWIPSGRVFYSPGLSDTPADELAFAQRHFFATYRTLDPFGNTALTLSDPYILLVSETRDALSNRVVAEQDYRVLQPFRVTDPNGNRGEVAFDTLGLLVGTAVMGKVGETRGDSLADFATNLTTQQRDAFLADPMTQAAALLGSASSRIVYDLERFRREGQPVFAALLARETHASDPAPAAGLRLQVSLSYSDGFGREIQKKLAANPGPLSAGGPVVSPRWIGSGWTIFNNKGKPVKQFEPFFDDTHAFRFDQQVGVSSTLFYDPLGRVVATLHPNHTWEKVIFDPWRQNSWDVNDTALIADPKTDPDVGDFFDRLTESEYLPTWYAQRQAGALGPEEKDAAVKTAMHAGTPLIAHADALGRMFLTIAHNKFKRKGTTPVDPPTEEFYSTRVVFDIEGNQREVIDANDRIVMRYDYDMLAAQIHQASMEAGERWTLNDATGQPIRAWDSRGHAFRTEYDALRRPLLSFVQGADPQNPSTEILFEKIEYGEERPNDIQLNLRGKPFRQYDSAGVMTNEAYDFKGNLLRSSRQLARDYKTVPDWSGNPAMVQQTFNGSTTYDALNRPVLVTTPDQSVYRPTFNEANLLEKVDVNLRGAQSATPFVTNIDHDAKGQRSLIEYGNNVKTSYEYDPLTFRLTRLQTLRGADRLQDLSYTYDPGGNITQILDNAQQTVYFNNQVVSPSNDYTYDAIYRLINVEGREHIGQMGQPQTTWDDRFRVRLPHPNDGQAMRRYTERYEYDSVGNFLELIHEAVNGNWTRSYSYNGPSLIDPSKQNNRLSSTEVGSNNPITETYGHDEHGNMTAMPHLPLMQWNFKDQLSATSRQVVNNGAPETTYYVYDKEGQRMRKVTERQNGTRKNERIYLNGFEVYREYDANGDLLTLERETLHVTDDKQRIALVETRTQGNDGSLAQLRRYQFGNHLGSASLELDESGQIISYEEYYPYGSTSYQAMRSQTETPKRYRHTGMERDDESGLCYHGSRYYAPWLSIWVSADPVSIAGGINLYEYGGSRPTALTDRTGTQPKPEDTSKASTDDDSTSPLTGNAALGVKDAVHRAEYKSKIKANSKEGVKKVKEALAAGDTKKAADIAKATSGNRNKIRLDTRAKSTPGGKAFAEAFDKPRLWDDIVRKYGDPYTNPAVAERIAFSAGKSRAAFNLLSGTFGLAAGAGLVWGVSISYRRIRDAPAGQKGLVAMEEGGGLLGSSAGAWFGGGWAGGLAAGLSLGPLGTFVLVGGGALGGGWLGDKVGRWAGRALHSGVAVIAMPLIYYQLTHMGMYLDDIAGPPELIEGEPLTPDYYDRVRRIDEYHRRRAQEQKELEEEIKHAKPYKPPQPLYELEPGTPWNGLPLGRNWTTVPPA
jgi:RHS repeat-associated protein